MDLSSLVLAGSRGPQALDPRVIILPLLLGLGLYLLVTAQPIGRPKPDLGEQLRLLDVDERIRLA